MNKQYYDFIVAADMLNGPEADEQNSPNATNWLYLCRLDNDGGKMRVFDSTKFPTDSPGYMQVVNTRSGSPMLYALSNSEVSWFALTDEKEVIFSGKVPVGSDSAAHLCIDKSARMLFTANYGDGTISWLPISEDGTLGEAHVLLNGQGVHHGIKGQWGDGPEFRQESAHPHGVVVCEDQLYVADLGSNEVVCWSIDFDACMLNRSSSITLHDLAGPRHIDFSNDGRFGYVLNELDNTVCVLSRDGGNNGELSLLQTISSLPLGWAEENQDPSGFPNEIYSQPSHASELLLAPDGRYLYASNRGHDSIAVFAVNGVDGTINPIQFEPTRGRIPWVFCMSEDGRFMIVQNNHSRIQAEGPDTVVVFERDNENGLLTLMPGRLEFNKISSIWSLPMA